MEKYYVSLEAIFKARDDFKKIALNKFAPDRVREKNADLWMICEELIERINEEGDQKVGLLRKPYNAIP